MISWSMKLNKEGKRPLMTTRKNPSRISKKLSRESKKKTKEASKKQKREAGRPSDNCFNLTNNSVNMKILGQL